MCTFMIMSRHHHHHMHWHHHNHLHYHFQHESEVNRMSVELKISSSIAMCSEHHLILSIDVQLLGFVKSSVRFMDLHAWRLQSIHASCHQFHQGSLFNFFSYCWKIVAVFNFCGKSVEVFSREVELN